MDANGKARGHYRWWTHPEPGVTSSLKAEVVCAEFDGPDAIFTAKITELVNWPEEYQCIEYAMIQVHDGGNPGRGQDTIGYYVGDCLPGFTFDPNCDPDNAFFFLGPLVAETGNLKIR